MTKVELLMLLRLLAAMQSAMIASEVPDMDFLHEQADQAMRRLTEEILK